MTLWQKLSTCNVNRVEEIYSRNVISTLVRHNLAEYIESRPWSQYHVENHAHQPDIQNEFHNFMLAIKWKIEELKNSGDLEKILDTSKRLEEQYHIVFKTYSNKPHEFISNMQHLLKEENKILMANETSDMKPLVEGGDISMVADLQGSLFALSFRQIKDLKSLIDEKIIALDDKSDFKRLTQEELQRKTSHYQSRLPQMSDTEQSNFNRNRDGYMRTLHTMHTQMGEVIVRLITLFEAISQQLKTAHSCILKDIDDWHDNQRRCMINGERPAPLDTIERNACMLADALSSCAGYYTRLRDHLDDMSDHRTHMLAWHSEIWKLIKALMAKCFIIEQQPPQVMKRDTRFPAQVRIIAGERWGFAIKQPIIKVSLVNMEQVQAILYVLNNQITEMPEIMCCGEVVNGEKVMEYSTQYKKVHLQFKNLVLKKLHRAADRRASELVTEEKFGVYFQCLVQSPYKDNNYQHAQLQDACLTLIAVSLPVTVTVHGSQSPAAEATIFWDNCFAPLNRESFAHPGAHPWGEVKGRISEWFKKCTERGLSTDALNYLGMKVLNTDSSEDLDSKLVTWQAFAKDTLKKPDRTFTFWEWLYSCIDLIKKHFLPMWKDNLIEGFISKARTEALLKAITTEPHTFLLRFADSTLGMISISYKQPDLTVKNLIYNGKDLQKVDLAQRILDPTAYKYLYPNILKESKFQKYYKAVKDEVPGYEKDLIKAHIPLDPYDSHPTTPTHQNMNIHPEFTEDFLMETIDYDMHLNHNQYRDHQFNNRDRL